MLRPPHPPRHDNSNYGPYILLITLLSNTLSLLSSLSVRDQVSHPYRTTGKITAMHDLICIFLTVDDRTELHGSKHYRNAIHPPLLTPVASGCYFTGLHSVCTRHSHYPRSLSIMRMAPGNNASRRTPAQDIDLSNCAQNLACSKERAGPSSLYTHRVPDNCDLLRYEAV
jgi:hypothetical protein